MYRFVTVVLLAISSFNVHAENVAVNPFSVKGEVLNFAIQQGDVNNLFYRNQQVAAHSVIYGGMTPHLVVGFPAENSGVSLWFKSTEKSLRWSHLSSPQPFWAKDSHGHTLYGVRWQGQLSASQIKVKRALLTNIRFIRNYWHGQSVPEVIVNQQNTSTNQVSWYRQRVDSKASYYLQVNVLNGQVISSPAGLQFIADGQQPLQLQITALTGAKPLTPLTKQALFNGHQRSDELTQNVLAFLSYKQKLLAGSWRFLTYFGRDTLMSVRLLMPVLSQQAIEAGLGSVLQRLNANGEVAHEEDLGEFALLEDKGKQPYDYKMLDSNYMLLPVMTDYLFNVLSTDEQRQHFLQRHLPDGRRYIDALKLNIRYVLANGASFAEQPVYKHLISLKPGHTVGNWRDSQEGLALKGRYPYDINAVLMPAALNAISRLKASGLLKGEDGNVNPDKVKHMANVWQQQAGKLFKVDISVSEALDKWQLYAARQKVPMYLPKGISSQLSFYALVLGQLGNPIPVIHSDIGYGLLFSQPNDKQLKRMLQVPMFHYPLGLTSPVGLMVSNPALAGSKTQALFGRNHYHGAVIWSWQQALLVAGLKRQLQRHDISPASHKMLQRYLSQAKQMVSNTRSVSQAELWSWQCQHGQFQIVPFGQQKGDLTESNAAQLWSTVYLAQ